MTLPRGCTARSRRACTHRYRISLRPGREGELQAVSLDGRRETLPAKRPRCYEALAGRQQPCTGCPVLPLRGPNGRGMVACESKDVYHVVTVLRRKAGTAELFAFAVSGDLLPALINAKLDRMATLAHLTERERHVLQLLVLGRPPRDIAVVLSMSRRTVKFHQLNLLAKLGADGRTDVLRLLLIP